MTRHNPMQHFHEIACEVLGTNNCFPVVQTGDPLTFPSVVYRGVGEETLDTLLSGGHRTASALRFEVRTTGAGAYGHAVSLAQRIIEALRRGGRLTQQLSQVDEFDDELGIYRRSYSVMVR